MCDPAYVAGIRKSLEFIFISHKKETKRNVSGKKAARA